MAKKTVFITGATGNMGWAGFREIYRKKDRFDIRILARPSKANLKKLKPYLDDPDVSIVWGDLLVYEDVLKGVSGSDFVLHVGGMVSPMADYYPEKTLKVNIGSTENVIRAIKAQSNADDIGLVYIGSVAQCGDRLTPIHWGRTGDPIYASMYDKYSVSKCEAERLVVDSGLKKWVSLRQSGILYTGILKQLNPVAFHVPLAGVLEWTTIEDSGRVLANVIEDYVPDEFWNRFYNIGSGKEYRMTNYDFMKMMFKAIGLPSIEKVFEPQWFVIRNFHGMWYSDGKVLDDYLHFRGNVPIEDYFRSMKKQLPWYYSLAFMVPAPVIRMVVRKFAFAEGLGTQWWIKNAPEKVRMYYGSVENYRNIRSWDDVRPPFIENDLDKAMDKGEVVMFNHGYDEFKSIYELSVNEIEIAAGFRGGKFLGPEDSVGKKGAIFEWECEHGHRFQASLEYVLLGGGWCSVCPLDKMQVSTTKANKFMYQILGNFNKADIRRRN